MDLEHFDVLIVGGGLSGVGAGLPPREPHGPGRGSHGHPAPATRRCGHAGAPLDRRFSPSYIARAMHLFPKQGDREPWLNPQSYSEDKRSLRDGAIDDGVLCFSA